MQQSHEFSMSLTDSNSSQIITPSLKTLKVSVGPFLNLEILPPKDIAAKILNRIGLNNFTLALWKNFQSWKPIIFSKTFLDGQVVYSLGK